MSASLTLSKIKILNQPNDNNSEQSLTGLPLTGVHTKEKQPGNTLLTCARHCGAFTRIVFPLRSLTLQSFLWRRKQAVGAAGDEASSPSTTRLFSSWRYRFSRQTSRWVQWIVTTSLLVHCVGAEIYLTHAEPAFIWLCSEKFRAFRCC